MAPDSGLIELYQPIMEAFNDRDKQAWIQLSQPELENTPPRDWPEAQVTTGPEAVWDFLVTNFETFDAEAIELAGPIEEGDGCLVIPLRADVRGRSSGIEIEFAYHQVAWFRDGKLARLAWFGDRDKAREAAGIA